MLENFKEFTENRVGAYETQINNDIMNDWKTHWSEIDQNQKKRNRDIIQEIVENTKIFQKDNHKRFGDWREADEAD